jgi:6-pyruvoyltetrahydropterin/6-carboxytetrahydropterin synthase
MGQYAHRYHDFSYGHRVYGHENKCADLHGHNGRVTFYCEGVELDSVGRVIDFGEIKRLCNWVEENWDHKTLIWQEDPWSFDLLKLNPNGVRIVLFNPTSENLALHLLNKVGPVLMSGTGVELTKVKFMETRKCGVTFRKEQTNGTIKHPHRTA